MINLRLCTDFRVRLASDELIMYDKAWMMDEEVVVAYFKAPYRCLSRKFKQDEDHVFNALS